MKRFGARLIRPPTAKSAANLRATSSLRGGAHSPLFVGSRLNRMAAHPSLQQRKQSTSTSSSSSQPPSSEPQPKLKTQFILFYEYVADAATKRPLHRAAHLRYAKEAADKGLFLMGGAWHDLSGAAIILNAPSMQAAEAFARADPYVRNGIVSSWKVKEWHVVAL
ncbi:YCII domain-containing protein [Balamuthia mandrillaris]